MPDDQHPPQRSVASRILRERALKQVRDMREKLDPAFLQAMQARFADLGLKLGMIRDEDMPLSMRNAQAPAEARPSYETQKTRSDFEPLLHNTDDMDKQVVPDIKADLIPVDKEKIASIVMEYMKKRGDKSRH